MKEFNSIVCAGLAVVSAGLVSMAHAATDATYKWINFSTSATEINPGEWNRNFKEVKAAAIEDNTPMFIFWGNNGCGYCEKLEKGMAKQTFIDYMQESGIYYCFAVKGDPKAGTQASAAKNASKDGSGEFPYIGFYYQDGDGKVVTRKGHGRSGAMSGPVKSGAIEEQLISTIKKWIGDWTPIKGGQFFVKSAGEVESEANRYETEAGRETVTVKLTRTAAAAKKEYAESLVIAGEDSVKTQKLSWAADEPVKELDIDVTGLKQDGDQLQLTLVDENGRPGKDGQTAKITFVEKKNSAANPLWKTERSTPAMAKLMRAGGAPALDFGEWTMDLEGAKQLAAQKGGYVLVSVQGSLWCPDCANTDRNFLEVEKDGANRFKAWAAEKKVALVSLDVPKFNSHGGADGPLVSFEETTAKAPTLLSREGMETTLARSGEYPASGASEELTKPLYRSGLGYLSRKGISDAEAEATLKRNWELITKDVSVGGFHEKTDSWLNRTGVPIFVLLNGKGEPVARFTQFASVSPMAEDQAKWDDYIQRFNEMLAIADDKAAAGVEATELGNNALVASSATELVANGGQAQGRVSAVDQQDAFFLKGMTGNARLAVTVTGDDRARVTVYLATDDDYKATGATTKKYVLDSKSFASGALDASGIRVTRAFDKPGDCFVVVKAESGVDVDSAEATFHAFTVKCEIDALLPSEAAAVANAPAGSDKIGIELENGCVYRLTGLADAGNADLEKKEGSSDIYTYTGATGKCQLTLATAGGEITFQKWNPGRVGFEPDYVTLPAKKTTKKDVTVTRKENVGIDIAYRRTEGYSGDVKVQVLFDREASTFFYDYALDPAARSKEIPRFYVNGSLDFLDNDVVAEAEWKDGVDLDDCRGLVSVTIRETEAQKIQSFFGDGCVVFKFVVVEETEAGEHVIDNGTFTVNFTENQKPKSGKVAYTAAVPYFSKAQTVYARESSEVRVTVSRVENDENPVYTTIKRSVATSTVKAATKLTDWWFDPDTQLLGWDNHDSEDRVLAVTNLPPAGKSVTLTLSPTTSGLKAVSSQKSVKIVSVADDAPAFVNENEAFTLYRYVAFSNDVAVTGLTEGALAFTKLSGSLPKGVSVKYNPVTRGMLVSGVPTADTGKKSGGKKTDVAYYQVTEKRPTEMKNKTNNVAGLVVRLELTVVDPVVAGTGDPETGAPLNAACAKGRKLNSIPFVDPEDVVPGKRRLAGVMNNLTLPVKGNASAKFVNENGTFSFSAKNWSALNPDNGTLGVRLNCTTKGYKDYYADVLVASNGTVEVSLTSGSEEYEQTVPGEAQWSVQNPATDYAGYYTVSLCDGYALSKEKFADYAPTGSGYLTLSLSAVKKIKSSSAEATGTMKWAGVLPNGKAVSGSSVLLNHGESAWLPYFTGKLGKAGEVFFGIADIVRGAAENIKAEDPCYKAVTVAVEVDPDDEEHFWEIPTFWYHTQEKSTNTLDYAEMFDVRGSYYDKQLKVLPLDCCCEAFHGSTNMFISLTMPGASEAFGTLGPVAPVELAVSQSSIAVKKGAANPQSLKLSFKKDTGIVSGSFKLPVENGKAQSASYKGVVVIGWGDGGSCSECGEGKFLPFVNGAWWFVDKAGYSAVSRGKVKDMTSKVNRGGTASIDSAKE